MRINTLLVRYAFGWWEVGEPAAEPYRSEAMLSLGAIQSVDELERVARQQLAVLGNPRTAIAADLIPVDETDTPYLAFGVGDTVTVPDFDGTPSVERVMALTVAEDDYGLPTYSPELKDIVLTDQERWQRNLDTLANGSVSGNSPVAQPVGNVAALGKDCCPPRPDSEEIPT